MFFFVIRHVNTDVVKRFIFFDLFFNPLRFFFPVKNLIVCFQFDVARLAVDPKVLAFNILLPARKGEFSQSSVANVLNLRSGLYKKIQFVFP